MSEDRVEKIEQILETIATKTAENTSRLDKVEQILETIATKTAENTSRLEELEVKLNENHLELRADFRRLEDKIDKTPDYVDKLYGATIKDILDRLSKLEDAQKS